MVCLDSKVQRYVGYFKHFGKLTARQHAPTAQTARSALLNGQRHATDRGPARERDDTAGYRVGQAWRFAQDDVRPNWREPLQLGGSPAPAFMRHPTDRPHRLELHVAGRVTELRLKWL